MVGETFRVFTRMARRVPVAGALVPGKDRLELDGRVVLVTGAARGLGAGIAREAFARGASIALVGRTLGPLESLAQELGEERAAAFRADVTDPEALEEATAGATARFGGVDVVVANAGVAPPSDPLLTIDPEAFERTVEVDLLGQWRTMRATLPAIIERRGHVLVISSVYAFLNGALNASYAASKAGVEQLVRAARVELAHHGATAGVAYLGFIDTDLVSDTFEQEHVVEATSGLPGFVMRRMTVEEAARACVDGVERRSPRVSAPAWVLPMLTMRGLSTTLVDEAMIASGTLSRAIQRAERRRV